MEKLVKYLLHTVMTEVTVLLILAEENVDITTKDDLDVSEIDELNDDSSSEEENDDRPDNGDLDKEPVDFEVKEDIVLT